MASLIVHPKDKEQPTILKTFMKAFKIAFEEEKSSYDTEFVAKIQESREQAKRGETRVVNIADLWSLKQWKMSTHNINLKWKSK